MRATAMRSRWPCSMFVKRATLVFSQSCSVFLRVVSLRLRIISLMLSFRLATSPCASTVIDRVKIALRHGRRNFGDGADLRGEVGGQLVDVVGQIAPDAGRAGTRAWPPSLPSIPTSRATVLT